MAQRIDRLTRLHSWLLAGVAGVTGFVIIGCTHRAASAPESASGSASAATAESPGSAPSSAPSAAAAPAASEGSPASGSSASAAPAAPSGPSVLLDGFKTLGDNGKFAGDLASFSVVKQAPKGAITEGDSALEITIKSNGKSNWQDKAAVWSGFSPKSWSPHKALSIDIYLSPGVGKGDWKTINLYGSTASVFYKKLSSDEPGVKDGANHVVFKLDYPAEIKAADELTEVRFILNHPSADASGTGKVYLDAIRLE